MRPPREAIAYFEPTAGTFFPRIAAMETKTDPADTPGPLFHPLTGWEAASRWNSAAFEWMTKGLQQWLSLVTISLAPTTAARAGDKVRPKRPARPKKPAGGSRSRG